MLLILAIRTSKICFKEICFKCNVSIISLSRFSNKALGAVHYMEWCRNCPREKSPAAMTMSLICSVHGEYP